MPELPTPELEPLSTTAARSIIKHDWAQSGYYDLAERHMEVFWTDTFPFYAQFRRLDLTDTVELACGHGRHTLQVVDQGRFTLVDVNAINVDFCRERFQGHPNVTVMECNGSSLAGIADAGTTAVFCYDAMVHFELEDVVAYLHEIMRVLRPGGQALLHFSNYDAAPGGLYHDNPHWRNFNSAKIFRHFATRTGFEVLHLQTLAWGHDLDLDALALIRKP